MSTLIFRTFGSISTIVALLSISLSTSRAAESGKWLPLFNGTNLSGWTVYLRNHPKNEDPTKLVQIDNGALHFYKDPEAESTQPFGYVATEKEFSDYRLRLEYRWGAKKFAPRARTVRDSGLLYHVSPTDKIWPDSVELQIQENDTGDIYAISTQVSSPVDPASTNVIISVATNLTTGVMRTNRSVNPKFLDASKGGTPFVQGRPGATLRIIRNPMNERDGWNTVEIIARGDQCTYIVNGVTNNQCQNIRRFSNGEWVPLNRGRIALQLEGAEVLYRRIEIQELGNK